DLAPDLGEGGRGAHHLVGDAGEDADLLGDAALGIDERGPLVDEFPVGHPHDPDLGDAIAERSGPRGLEVDERDGGREHEMGVRDDFPRDYSRIPPFRKSSLTPVSIQLMAHHTSYPHGPPARQIPSPPYP